ncbi:MAG: hypothetical protein IEMM0002_0670 [bacterium]|nr:MAG: hypothetical protein IEMM0002_0670 [bacterium]
MLEKLKVLVLNNTYEPLHFCIAKRAIVMVINGRAEQIESDGIMVHTFSGRFQCPTVIKLKRYIRIPRWIGVTFSKRNVLIRDNKTCQYCGATGVALHHRPYHPALLGG